MLALLILEDVHNKQRFNLNKNKLNSKLKLKLKRMCPAPWVANISRKEERVFVRGHWNYEKSNNQGTRGITVSFFLKEKNKYEVFNPKQNKKYICSIKNGEICKQ